MDNSLLQDTTYASTRCWLLISFNHQTRQKKRKKIIVAKAVLRCYVA